MRSSGSSTGLLGRKPVGFETPRLWTKPLRELTPETSHGFAVIDFARDILDIELYPWQKWLLIHALELNEDGTYRFRKIFVIVGRQNGKTTLLTVLALFWLFMDAEAFPDHLPAHKFLVLGIAQNLDVAEEAWDEALKRCDPKPDEDDEMFVVEDLAAEARIPVKTNGKKSLRLKNNASYEPRAASRAGGRGKRAARIIMDEMREQQTWDVWGSVSKTKNAIYNSQLWGISSAGDVKSIVLRALRDGQLKAIEAWEQYVETGLKKLEEYANEYDLATGLFEWSAPEGADLLDLDGILQANPSIGHTPMFFESIWSDLLGDEEDAVKRTEILCQWIGSSQKPHLDGERWQELEDPMSEIAEGSPIALGLDTSPDRAYTFLSIAGVRDDGRVHVEQIAQRAGMLWALEAVPKLLEAWPEIKGVALQSRGTAAVDFIEPFKRAGVPLLLIEGSILGSAVGRISDRVRDGQLRHLGQPSLNMSVSGAVSKKLNEQRVWDREKSGTHSGPIVSASHALLGLEIMPDPEPEPRSVYEDRGLVTT